MDNDRAQDKAYLSSGQLEQPHLLLWVKVDGKVFNLEQPVIFGTIYIQPEYTRYSSDEAFNQIEHELHSFSTYSKYVGLIVDFNSRTGEDA